SGGVNKIANNFQICNLTGVRGVYNLSGNGSLAVSGSEFVGFVGIGTFAQTGGANSANYLQLGNYGGAGNYTLSSTGTLSVAGYEDIGADGTGIFNQSGGSNVCGGLDVGWIGTGVYTLSAGSLFAANEFVGYN